MKVMTLAESGPVYKYIEFCSNAEALWHKLQSGHWDWLGVHPKGQFVLGRPRRRGGFTGLAIPTLTEGGASVGQHGIKIYSWSGQPNPKPSSRWVSNAEKARARFEEEIERLQDPKLPAVLAKVVLIQNGQATDETFIAQIPPLPTISSLGGLHITPLPCVC
jgi:hypothetical protein